MPPTVDVYSTGPCGYCRRTRRLLDRKGVTYHEIRVDIDRERFAEMVARSGRDSVPQVFVDDRHLGGYEELVELDLDGDLDRMLGLA